MLRFAPSPTGDMHIGNLRIAILNYLIAQQKNDNFFVRIEDGDSKGNIEGKDTEIMMLLEKFALKHDSVFHQSEHLNLHQTLALRLLKEEKAFICKCIDEVPENKNYAGECAHLTPEDYTALKESGEPFVIRIKKPTIEINYQDILQGKITTTPDEVDAFVILRKDGTPSSTFASACDDIMSDIDFIIREEKHLSNTPKQIHIKNLLGYEKETTYAHIPTPVNSTPPNSSVKWFFEQGFIPDAILNYLLLLGYSEAPKEIFTLPQAIEWFNLKNISTSAVSIDMDKLRFINQEHLKMMDDRQLSTLFGFADSDIGKLAKVYLEECSTTNELEAKIRPIFSPKNFKGEYGEEMKMMEEIIFNAPTFESFSQLKEHIIKESEIKEENVLKALRYLLTGAHQGPELSKIYPFIKSYILEVAS